VEDRSGRRGRSLTHSRSCRSGTRQATTPSSSSRSLSPASTISPLTARASGLWLSGRANLVSPPRSRSTPAPPSARSVVTARLSTRSPCAPLALSEQCSSLSLVFLSLFVSCQNLASRPRLHQYRFRRLLRLCTQRCPLQVRLAVSSPHAVRSVTRLRSFRRTLRLNGKRRTSAPLRRIDWRRKGRPPRRFCCAREGRLRRELLPRQCLVAFEFSGRQSEALGCCESEGRPGMEV
jgi:hypothetical protein